MKRVERIQTSDGKLHVDINTATRHADERYHKALEAIAVRVVRTEKYTDMCDFINANLGQFEELSSLRADYEDFTDTIEA